MDSLSRSKPRGNSYRDEQHQDKPCRTCVDFKTWAQEQNKTYNDESKGADVHTTATDRVKRADCPLDKDELGRHTWGFLHTLASHYPESPSPLDKREVSQFFTLFSKFYPCEHCAKDFRKELKKSPPVTTSQEDLSQWLCRVHNNVNVRLGKSKFDCSLVNQRWRDGWKDGSCD